MDADLDPRLRGRLEEELRRFPAPAARALAPRRAVGPVAAIAVAVVVVLIAGLAGAGLRTVREQSPASQPPATAVPVVVASEAPPTNPLAACRSGQLGGSFENNGVASGTYGVSFRLGVATGACVASANLPVQFLDATGATILSAVQATSLGPPQTLRTAPAKDAAFLTIQWSGHGTEPGYRCATMGPPIASVTVDLGRPAGFPADVSNVLVLSVPAAQRFSFCVDPPERVFASIVGSRPLSRTDLVKRFSGITSEVRRIDRIEAKLMTRLDFEQGSDSTHTSASPGTNPNQEIWVIAISGEVVPQMARGSVFPWGIYLVDAYRGDTIGLLAGAGAWPSYFDSLPDRDRR